MRTIKISAAVILAGALAVPAKAGKVVLEGSTTVLPIAQKAAEVYMKKHADAELVVRGGGSGVGIASLIDGTCDIADASRAVKDSELAKALKKQRELKAHIVAMDGIAVIVHPSNKLGALTLEQVRDIFTGRISNWEKVGGEDKRLVAVSRDSASGTFEAFGELVLEKRRARPDAVVQASNQGVASVVARTPGAIGYVGLGYISDAVKALEIDGTAPGRKAVLLNKYPISRPLFMYTDGAPKGEVKRFIDFVKSAEGQKIAEEEGFIGLR